MENPEKQNNQFDEDIKIFCDKRIKGQQKNFRVSKKFLYENFPTVFEFKKYKNQFVIKDIDKAKLILEKFYIPYMENTGVKVYINKDGYAVREFYKYKQPRPYEIIKTEFNKHPEIQEYLTQHITDPVKKKIEYLTQFLPENLKTLTDKQIYQIIHKYINYV